MNPGLILWLKYFKQEINRYFESNGNKVVNEIYLGYDIFSTIGKNFLGTLKSVKISLIHNITSM